MSRIAISYRRDDSAAITGRIFDRLVAHYGGDTVFRDVDNIPLGVDFREYINTMLAQTDITLVVVGKRWFGAGRGRRRIDDPADPVRVEVETALRRGMPVVPLLVEGAGMPNADQLPDSLKELVYRNGLGVDSGRDFDQHIERLIRNIEPILARRAQERADAAQRAEAARQAEEEKRRAEAVRQAEDEKRQAQAAHQAEEEKRRVEAARQAEEERRQAETAQQAEKEKRRAEAARQAEEEKRRAEAARQAEEEKQRAAAARQAGEEKQRAEAARQAEEEKQRAEAARQAEEEKRRAEAARQAEEEKRRAQAAQQAEEEKRRGEAARPAEEEKRRTEARNIGQSVWMGMRWVLFAVALFVLFGSLVADHRDLTAFVIGLLLAIAVGPYSSVMWRRIGTAVRGAKPVPAPPDARAYQPTNQARHRARKPGLGASREGAAAKNSVTAEWKSLPFWGKIGFLISYFFSWPICVAWLPKWLKPFILIIWLLSLFSVSVKILSSPG